MLLFAGITTVNATEYEESLIKRIAPDGENAVFKAEKPAGAASRAIKFSDEVIQLTDGGNYAFQLEVGMGRQGDEFMYESAYGEVAVFFNGYAYESKSQGVHLKRVLYIPEDTEDTPKAYIAAAQKRINDYWGTDEYEAYDIKLYSDGKGASITELENGMFLVSIPVSTALSGKTIAVYYFNSQNELEVHDEIIFDDEGIASFETNHFSTYILTETKVTAPDTGSAGVDISLYLTIAVASIGLVVLRKKMK